MAVAEEESLLCKIKTAILNGHSLQLILAPHQYQAYLELESLRATSAASHDPSKPLPYLLRVLPEPIAASLKPPPAAPKVPRIKIKIKKRPRPDLEPRALPPECRECLANKGVALDDGNLKLIFIKSLFKTDVNPHHMRLSMPCNQEKAKFLMPEEERSLQGSERINVVVIDPLMKEQTMSLARWNIGNSWSYALIHDWGKLVKANELVREDVIQVWSFRFEDNQLGLLIHKVESGPSDNESDGSSSIGDHERPDGSSSGGDHVRLSDGSSSSGDDGYMTIRWGSKKRRGWIGVKHHSI